MHQICEAFGLIWDEADELHQLARVSHPRVVIDTAGLPPTRTLLANLLAQRMATLPDSAVAAMLEVLETK